MSGGGKVFWKLVCYAVLLLTVGYLFWAFGRAVEIYL